MKVIAAAVAAAIVCATAGAARGTNVNLLGSFKPALAKVEHSSVAVLLPATLPILDKAKVYASGSGNGTSWDLELAFAPDCHQATACFLASFQAQTGAPLPGKANAHLSGGDPAQYHKSMCGASCAPASLWFVHRGVLYGWQDSDIAAKGAEAFLIGLANKAIAAGPR